MVSHSVVVRGVDLSGAAQLEPVLMQMNAEDFPGGFLRDLGAMGNPALSSTQSLLTGPATPVTLYSPVQRVVHLALLQLACDTVQFPRLDPTRVISAGFVVRRIQRSKGVDDLAAPPWAWMRSADGQYQWVRLDRSQERNDPDPARRPQIQSGQSELDRLLSLQNLTSAMTEITTPAFVAAPDVCNAAGRTLVYGIIPTASSEIATQAPASPQYDPQALATALPPLLQAGGSSAAPQANNVMDYRYMSDEYARAHGATDFLIFSAALRLLYTVAGAFENTAEAQQLVAVLNARNVSAYVNGVATAVPMGDFFQAAAAALIDYDPDNGQPVPGVTMPYAWDALGAADQNALVNAMSAALRARSSKVLTPQGRFQDPSRLYRLRVFFRIKGENPDCPPQLVWSRFSDPFRIAAWYESSGRPTAPVPLPDPTDRDFIKNAKPSAFFAVPAGLMNALQGTTLAGLSSGAKPAPGPGANLNWICGFSIPLITICAFIVLNIFLSLLNIVFFWLPFIKICIPVPIPVAGSNSGDD